MDSTSPEETVTAIPKSVPKTKRTTLKRFTSFNRKKSIDDNENVLKPKPKQTKKVQAVKPTKKSVMRKEKSFEEPFPEVSGKSMDIFEVAEEPKKTLTVATPTAKRKRSRKLLSKARFGFGDTTDKPPKPARGQIPSTSSEESIDEENFVIVDNPVKQGVLTKTLKNFFFVYYFTTAWFV